MNHQRRARLAGPSEIRAVAAVSNRPFAALNGLWPCPVTPPALSALGDLLRGRGVDKVPSPMMRFMRSFLWMLTLCVVTSVSLAPTTVRAGVTELHRVAVLDVQRVIMETKQGRKAKEDLEKTFAKSQARLENKEKDLAKQVEDLRAKAPMLSPERLAQRQEELGRGQAELERLSAELQQEIMQKEALLTEKIYKNVTAIVKQIALEEKLQVVLVRGDMTVLYANPKLDVTNRVIVAYDKKYP